MNENHTELIKKSQVGDTDAFSQLVHLYEDKIFNLAQKVCSSVPAEADDVIQDTFLTAFKKLHQFRISADLGTWLYRIASNLCFMRLRKKRHVKEISLDQSQDGISAGVLQKWLDDKDDQTRKKELSDAVARSLAQLPLEFRMVVTLKDIEGLSLEEISQQLDLSLAAVKSRLHRGRGYLRDHFFKNS